jgi:hypothetical protein
VQVMSYYVADAATVAVEPTPGQSHVQGSSRSD